MARGYSLPDDGHSAPALTGAILVYALTLSGTGHTRELHLSAGQKGIYSFWVHVDALQITVRYV
jgi:hypothetical protein